MTSPTSSPSSGSTADGFRTFGEAEGSRKPINVSQSERQISTLAGVGLAVAGIVKGGLSGLLLTGAGAAVAWRGLSGHCSLYEKMGVDTARNDRPRPSLFENAGVKIEQTITVNKDAQTLYDYWRDFSNLPKFMQNVERIDVEGDGSRSHWVIKGPAGIRTEYDAEIINDEPGKLIAWKTAGHADVDHAGTVRFEKPRDGEGTLVHVNIEYLPPAGRWTAALARLIGQDPASDVREDLRRFKQIHEAGETGTTEG